MRKSATTSTRTTKGKSTNSFEPIVFRAIGEPGRNGQCVTEEAIRLWAYAKWEEAGNRPGDGVQFWLDAERQLKAKQQQLSKR
jgi:hypothetical protein